MGDRRYAWKAFSRVGIGYGAFLLVTFVLQLEIGTIAAALSRFGVEIVFGDGYILGSSFATYAVGGVVTYFIVKDMQVLGRPQAKKAGVKMLAAAFLICMSALFFGNLIGQALMSIVCALQGKPMVNPVEEIMEGLSSWTIFVTMVVMAPVCEEILYRKVLIDRIRLYGDKAAIVVSGFVFALSHGNFYQFFYAFGIGLVFAYIYIQTGRLRYTIAFHMMINFLGSIAALHVEDAAWLSAVYSVFMLTAVLSGTILFFISRKKLVLESGMEETWGKGTFPILFLNPGMILFFLASAATFVISEIS
ncbi:CPBP family intramembrane glutamic endopeptidase [Clostridium sp. Marseille-P2415]|uniref:CPBP family intramembrane glutamic endopeptidase n=1 Tax=Clostridium sp. Marseille-P2415 TaxID=1805471 RepID=UPI0009883AE3|nr:type II CAAX endopeptidase family protein [Clostridium sp. Marseille-P2415]